MAESKPNAWNDKQLKIAAEDLKHADKFLQGDAVHFALSINAHEAVGYIIKTLERWREDLQLQIQACARDFRPEPKKPEKDPAQPATAEETTAPHDHICLANRTHRMAVKWQCKEAGCDDTERTCRNCLYG